MLVFVWNSLMEEAVWTQKTLEAWCYHTNECPGFIPDDACSPVRLVESSALSRFRSSCMLVAAIAMGTASVLLYF